jgi:RNA:NAD 2'-phosphotransferase (TPT1/KptA family)
MTAPWIYIPKISTVYSGKPGQVHADIYDDVEWDELDIQGVVDLRVPDMPRFVAHLEERGLTQADMEPVRQALSQWSGKDIRWDWPGYDATFEEMYRQAFPKLGSSPDLSHYPDQGDVDPKDWEKRYASLTGDWHGRVGKTQKKAMPLSPDSPGLPTHFYHVAPAEHHDQIMQQGLLPGSDSNSPWTTERSGWDWDHQQPGGVYLWDDLDHARMYAHVLAGKNHELPDSSDGWMEQYPEWYTDPDDPYWEEEGMEPPEAEQPPAWNIYRVPAEAVRDLRMDPEAWNRPGDGATTYDEAMAQVEEGMDFDEGIYEHDTTEGHRYYTPHPISSNVLEFVEARDLKDMAMYDFENSDWSEGSYNARVPEPLTRVPDLTESPLADPNWTWDKHRNSRLGASRNVGEIIAEKVGGRWNSYLESVEWPDGQKVYIDIQDNWGTLELMNIRAEPEGTGAGAEVLKAIQSLEMPIRANEVTNPGFFEHHGFQPDEDYDEELWGNDEPDQWWFPKEANAWGDEGEEKFDWSNPPLPNGDCPKCGEPAYVWGEAQMALCGSCGNYSILHDDKWSHVPNFGDFDSMMKRYLASKTAGRLHHWQNRHTASDLFSILKKWQGDPQIAMAQSSPAEQQALLEAVHSNNPGPGPFYRGQRTSFPEPTDSEIRGWTRNWIQALNRCSGTITTADGEVIHDTRLQVELGPGENLTTVIYAADGAERGLDLSATLAEDYLFSNEEEVILPGDSLLGYQKFDVLIAEGGTEGRIVTVEEVTNAVANALRGRTAKTAAPAPDDWQEQVTRRYYNQAQPEPPQYGYHGTTKARAERILKEGLKPWDSPDVDQVHGNPFEYEYYEPRPGHVYLALDPKIAIDATHDIDDDREGGATVLRIDLSKLDPQKINPDEDGHPQAGNYEEWEEADYDKWPTLGIWAEDTGFGNDPYETVDQLNGYNSLAYRGVIPPEAISEAGGVEGGMWPDRSSDGLRTAMANMNNYRLSAYDDSLWENSKPKPKGQDGQVIITDNMYEDWSEGDKDGLPRFFHCPECGSTGIWHDSDENSGECLDCKAQWGLDEAPDSLIHEGNR